MVFKSRKFAKTLASVVSCSIFSACSSQDSCAVRWKTGDSVVPCSRFSPCSSEVPFLVRWKTGDIECCFNYETGNLHIYGRGPIYWHLFDDHPIKEKIKSITIGSYITDINLGVFSDCTSLESILMEGDVGAQLDLDTYLLFGKLANEKFTKNGNKTYITIMHELIHSLRKIGFRAFESCTSLKNVKLPNSVTEIGGYAFYKCTSLESIDIPNLVTKIDFCVFGDCTSLKNVKIPNSVTEINSHAFDNCISLKNINIPDSVTEIGKWAFQKCTSLENIDIPKLVTKIDFCVFQDCTSLKSVKIPNSVTEIDSCAFDNCISLKNINIPDSVTEIGRYAFRGCPITRVSIPKNAKVADDAFDSNTIVERRQW